MTYILNKLALCLMILLVPVLIAASVQTVSSDIEEGPDTALASDYIITGIVDEYNGTSISVDKVRYSLCKDVIVYSPANKKISAMDLRGAEEAKLFENRRCIRKIKVLRFAQ